MKADPAVEATCLALLVVTNWADLSGLSDDVVYRLAGVDRP